MTSLADAALDAARECVLAYGVRRTTLTDVARRAGVSRMSIYRRWPDVSSLVADVMSREWHNVIMADRTPTALPAARGEPLPGSGSPEGSPARPTDIAHIVQAAGALRAHPLLRKIIEADPEVLLPYILDRRGTSQQEMLTFLEAALRKGQAAGQIRPGDPGTMARAVLLTVQSFVLSTAVVVDPTHTVTDLDQELGLLLQRYLSP